MLYKIIKTRSFSEFIALPVLLKLWINNKIGNITIYKFLLIFPSNFLEPGYCGMAALVAMGLHTSATVEH